MIKRLRQVSEHDFYPSFMVSSYSYNNNIALWNRFHERETSLFVAVPLTIFLSERDEIVHFQREINNNISSFSDTYLKRLSLITRSIIIFTSVTNRTLKYAKKVSRCPIFVAIYIPLEFGYFSFHKTRVTIISKIKE